MKAVPPRGLPLLNRAVELTPAAQACCGACRTCVTTNVVTLALAAAGGGARGVPPPPPGGPRVDGRRGSRAVVPTASTAASAPSTVQARPSPAGAALSATTIAAAPSPEPASHG